ncbi:Trans-resveratrol di-O-methyltransferase [Ananas comosus]|uniref:Trans-resveratrol di-O-methyltransferase n=1 Tax=Ananas comosus TaxID=4615 RepID=A0A199W7J9_ANACO|nr:Trans-resveratrol di-O-methyltransferase [Ananas comosus]
MEYTVESKDLLEAQSHVWNHIFNFINSMSLKCAVELGIPDAVHSNGGRPISLCELANKLSIPSTRIDDLRRLMRLLVHSGFFTSQKIEKGVGDGMRDVEHFLPTINSSLLLKENDISVSPFVLAMLDRIFALPWHSLGEWFRQSMVPTAFEIAHGDHLWGVTNKNASFSDSFNEGMASDASLVGKLVARVCANTFSGLRSVVDVGGGTGTMARTIAKALPQVQFTVFDLPHVVEGLKSEENGAIAFVGGDMFEYIPSADAVLLKWILHDWSDEDCVKHNFSSIYVLMMVVTSGKQRNEKEWNKLFTDAGYKQYKILNALGLRSVIEVYY